MYYQTRKTRNKYRNFPPPEDCHFCHPVKYSEPITAENKSAFIIPNRTFYDQWEMSRVIDHLLLVPRRHVLSLNDLHDDEKLDVMQLLAEYEDKGYEIYARSPVNITRSVPHQHTHLIKTDHRPARGMLFWRRPWILKLFR